MMGTKSKVHRTQKSSQMPNLRQYEHQSKLQFTDYI